MINLMPYELKKQTAAARVNHILFNLVVMLVIAAIFLILACSIAYLLLLKAKISTDSQQLKINTSTNPVQRQANTFRANLAISKSILDQQISYSSILKGLGSAMPTGTILNAIAINDGSFGTTIKLKVFSTSSDNEARLKQNFESSGIFSNYQLESTMSSQEGGTKYPFTINISITLNKGSMI